jgi:peroxiredoxin Q/BCP
MPAIDQVIEEFELATTSEKLFKPSELRGKHIVVYFYPKDDTPGCTDEGLQFTELFDAFTAANCLIFGLSRDTVKSHERFKAKMNFPFELISDPEELACGLFGVMKQKNMYGKQVRGIERSTFVIDAQGVLRQEWRGVKVPGHAQAVLDFIKTL